jgi:hypothetical protein
MSRTKKQNIEGLTVQVGIPVPVLRMLLKDSGNLLEEDRDLELSEIKAFLAFMDTLPDNVKADKEIKACYKSVKSVAKRLESMEEED